MIDAALQNVWYGRSAVRWIAVLILLPLTAVFAAVTSVRKLCYRLGLLRVERVSQPVIVVGNITVGGTGKTPLVIWLCEAQGSLGEVPGIVTRGYGGSSTHWPRDVLADSDPNEVGDEAVLLAQRTRAIVIAGPDRVASARRAIERGATLVISDDGLQHYRLARDFEIAVVDSGRGLGNGWRLPAGPLRESARRLSSVDAVVHNDRELRSVGSSRSSAAIVMRAKIDSIRSLSNGKEDSLASLSGLHVHALAAIGNPRAFFDSLERAGLKVSGHALRDHSRISERDLAFDGTDPILMTEKDAVKCRAFANSRMWSVPLKLEVEGAERLLSSIASRLDRKR